MREKLNGVELGMWADTILAIFPKSMMVREPVVIGNEGADTLGNAKYVVKWVYPGFTLTFNRAEMNDAKFGMISVYAVQQIDVNNHKPKRGNTNARRKRRTGFHR